MLSKLLVIDEVKQRKELWAEPRWIPVHQSNLYTYFPIDLDLDSFTTGPSDYECPSDEINCPCGETLPWESGTVGDAGRIAKEHMRKAHLTQWIAAKFRGMQG